MATFDPALWEQRGEAWYRMDGGSGPHYLRACEGCGEPFLSQRRKPWRGRSRFCTMACAKRTEPTLPSAKTGDPSSYGAAHERVYRARGRASAQSCLDCGRPAAQWSQIHGTTGQEPEHYAPRCRECHERYDIDLKPRGERNGKAKLTDAQRRGIRASVIPYGGLREYARHLGVRHETIMRIRRSR